MAFQQRLAPQGHSPGQPQQLGQRQPGPLPGGGSSSNGAVSSGLDTVYSWLQGSWSGLGGLFASGPLVGTPLTKQCMSPSLVESTLGSRAAAHHLGPAGSHGEQTIYIDPLSPAMAASWEPSAAGYATRSREPWERSAIGYEVDKEDLLDQHVGYYFRHHPDVYAQHTLIRIRPGAYCLDGREVKVEWQYAAEPGGQGFLVVVDGPLRQPFADYMEMSEQNAEYDTQGVQSASALHSIPKEKRMSFHDQHKLYSRLEAMKVAKEQALVRERAADYIKDGRDVPGELLMKYKKTIQMKLDPGGRQRAARQRGQQEAAAVPAPPPPPPGMPTPPGAPAPAAGAAAPGGKPGGKPGAAAGGPRAGSEPPGRTSTQPQAELPVHSWRG